MRVHICAVGRMKTGPERALLDDYLARFGRTGRGLGLGPVTMHEVDDRKGGGMPAEAALLRKALPDGAVKLALDERGKLMSSPDFADVLARHRDDGRGGGVRLQRQRRHPDQHDRLVPALCPASRPSGTAANPAGRS